MFQRDRVATSSTREGKTNNRREWSRSLMSGQGPDYTRPDTVPAEDRGRPGRRRNNERRVSGKKFRGVPSSAKVGRSGRNGVGYNAEKIYRRMEAPNLYTKERSIIAESRIGSSDVHHTKYRANPLLQTKNEQRSKYDYKLFQVSNVNKNANLYDVETRRSPEKIDYSSLIKVDNPDGIFKLQIEKNVIALQLARALRLKDYMRNGCELFLYSNFNILVFVAIYI